MVSALLFDLDGTLFDSRKANVAAYTDAFAEVGLALDVASYRKNFGLRFDDMMELVAPQLDAKKRTHIKRLKAKYYRQNLHMVRQNEGLISLLKSASPHYKTALVTTASRQNVTALLKYFGLSESTFDVVVFGHQVSRGKPDPEAYQLALTKLGTPPGEACIFEDSVVGLKAARASGAHVVRVRL